MSDDTPTQRLPQTEDAGELVEERKKSRALLFTLIGVGAALLIAIIVLLIILFGGGANGGEASPTPTTSESTSPTPSDSPTPSESPTPTPTPTPTQDAAPPPDTSPGFASFNLSTQNVQCQSPPAPGGGGVVPPNPQVRFNWTAKNASSVWFVFGTSDAADAGAFELPLSGNQDEIYGPDSLEFPCYQSEQKYTLTVVGNNGQHVSKTFTVKNTGWVQ